MELNDDSEIGNDLRNVLREWEAPPLLPSLEERVLRSRRTRPHQILLRFLLTGNIRIPVPVAACLVVLIAVLAWRVAILTVISQPQVVVRTERVEIPVDRIVEKIVYRDRPTPAAIQQPNEVELLPVTELRARIIRASDERVQQ